jgi:aldehyde dehydrogenase (NAD+)
LFETYNARAEEMAQTISQEMGAPIDLVRSAQVGASAAHLKSTIRALKFFNFEHPLGDHALDNIILHEAIGVCALITPWNWPMN